MSSEKQVKAEPCAGTFSGCLVEGDAETTARERRIKRRAVGVSITLQTAGLAALLIAPLFAKPAALVERVATPIPPYNHHAARHESVPPTPQQTAQVCVICPTLPTRPAMPAQIQGVAPEAPEISRTGEAGAGLIELVGPPPGPDLVLEKSKREQKRIVVGHLDPALLIHRVEPVYPAIPKQLHRSGKVELRAVIATDGSVQSLQVVSGDPLFINSAREAVLQWRYKPTYLNGEPVEIDTYITVIYTLQ